MASASPHPDHIHFMRIALALGRRGLGNVAPNPAVGCVIVKGSRIVGRGWTQPGGRPHAETGALQQAGDHARGATAYVTLEPCSHHGKTPPCADALIEAGIQRVVVAAIDNDNRVSGRGIDRLKAAGIEVLTGVLGREATRINQGFSLTKSANRPLFSLKLATSLDGKIALKNGESRWITGSYAREVGHRLRASHDAILVGVNTVLTDNPSLDCRIAGLRDRSPIRLVLDTALRTPLNSKIVKAADQIPTIIFTSVQDEATIAPFLLHRVTVRQMPNLRNLTEVAADMAKLGLTRVLIEGGAAISAAFLRAGFVDQIYHFQAGKLLGNDSLSAVGQLDLPSLACSATYQLASNRQMGPDLLATWRKAE